MSFSGERVDTRGYIDLYTKFGEGAATCKVIKIRYLLVEANNSYNVLLGRPSLNDLGAIVSTPHLVMKFPSASGDVITLHVDQKMARECYAASLKIEPREEREEGEKRSFERSRERTQRCEHMVVVTDLDPRVDDIRVEPGEEVCSIPIKDPRTLYQDRSFAVRNRERQINQAADGQHRHVCMDDN